MKFRRSLWRLLLALAGLGLLGFGGERALDALFPYPLDKLESLELSTVVTSADGTWLQVWPTSRGERVLKTEWAALSPYLREAILIAEDERFFEHRGVDVRAALRALRQNLSAGRVVSGASTLTMQLVRIVEPRPRTLSAKIVEMFRARQLERKLPKEAILDLWANQVPMGGTIRGMETAARVWFGKAAPELEPSEAATLVAMVPAPTARAPDKHPEFLRSKRNELLHRMAIRGSLRPAELASAVKRPLGASRHAWPQQAWHLCASEISTLSPHRRPHFLPTGADLGLHERLLRMLAAKSDLPGDGLGIVVLDRHSGRARALIGSRTSTPELLDGTRCRRSVGSTLKPFLYALAMEQGIVADSTVLDDVPLDLEGWRPANFHEGFAGRTRAADALATSANLPAVRCLLKTGVGPFHDLLASLGLPISPGGIQLDAALGTLSASPLELARAYHRFAEHPQMAGLSSRSVDWTLGALSRLPAGRAHTVPGRLAWKSGTSSGRRDAWCVGLTDDQVVVVWLGNLTGRGEADLIGTSAGVELLGEVVSRL